ncbi:MAG: hypothetical protein M3Y17_00800 [Actinomycetota bacterium]|nr:hypothetical protein [Actinomycetota bacterium]
MQLGSYAALATAIAQSRTLLTENVAGFARIAADHHHPGVLAGGITC